MGGRRRQRIRTWAEELVALHGADVARMVGLDGPLPDVRIDVQPAGPPGLTSGLTITLSEAWFAEHPDDAGCVIHELAHAYMRAPRYDDTTVWLIEGLADHVRDTLGLEASWTFAHFEAGKATAGYQTTADFLAWLDGRDPGASVELCRRLIADTYDEGAFGDIAGRPLTDLVAAYEADRSRSAPGPTLTA